MNAELNFSATAAFTFAAPDGLRVNLLSAPFGIPKEAPAFSWVMRSSEVGDIQTSYRIVIARRLSDMAEGDYLLDTGWIVTDDSSFVTIAGLDSLLSDNELYYWAVQLRNRSGAESAMSAPAAFSTAPGNDWESTCAVWAAPNVPPPAEQPASETTVAEAGNTLPTPDAKTPDFCFLRGEFELDDTDEIEAALLSVTASSPEPSRQYVYHAYLNGSLLGLGPTRLGRAATGEELLYFNTYDVTGMLRSGKNALGALCYTQADHQYLCQLTLFFRDGEKEILFNSARDTAHMYGMDASPVFSAGGVSHSIGTQYFRADAENIDATLYPFGFSLPDFDASVFAPVTLGQDMEIEHERMLAPYPGDNVERYIQDIALVEKRGENHYFVDLGVEIVGGLRLTVNAEESATIRLQFGEELCEDGSVRSPMRTGNDYHEYWTLKPGEQTLENICSMKTFRYVEIFDCPVPLSEDHIQGLSIRRAFDAEESSFTCSNEVLCRLYDTYKYAICATNQDLYVDSQSRERCAYEGDAWINMLSSYTYESKMALPRFTIEYLLSHRTWPAEYALMPIHMVRLDYLYSGNRALLERAYPKLLALLHAEHPDESTGLYPGKAAPNNTHDSILVDWPPVSRDGYAMAEAHYNTVYNSILYLSLRDMAVMAHALGKEDEANTFTATADGLRRDMIEQLYDPALSAFRDGLDREGMPVAHYAQHATIFALSCGVYSDVAMKDAMGRHLVGQESIRTSIYGAFFLFEALYRAGFGAYATALLADDDKTPGAHSFLASLCGGQVTIAPEAWSVAEKGNMTFSHPWGTTPAAMIVRGMFGIRPTKPGFRKFDIRPQIGDLPYASIRVPTVRGTIAVALGQNREAYEAEVKVPPNTTATVYLPMVAGGSNTLFVNNQKSNFPLEDGYFRITLGAGTHRLLAQ